MVLPLVLSLAMVGHAPAHAAKTNTHCPALPGGTGLLKDGDFREQTNPGGGVTLYRGSVFAPGWTRIVRGSIDFLGPTGWGPQPPNAVCTVDLDGLSAGAIQTSRFATVPDTGYTVQFLLSANGFCPPATKTLEVEAGGQSEQIVWTVASEGSAQQGSWQNETWQFTATTPKTALRFISLDPHRDHCGPVIGAVVVSQT